MRGLLVLSSLTMLCPGVEAAQTPRFSDYKVVQVYRGKRAEPKVRPDMREYPGYRAVLMDSVEPSNFAGHYVVSEDTCGTDSVRMTIADARTGQVFDRIPCFFWGEYVIGPKSRPDLPHGVEYRLNSRLLIAHGCFDDVDNPRCGDHYFTMTPTGLVPIFWRTFKPPVTTSK